MSRKPQVILTIGHRSFLMPDDTGLSSVMKALSRALPVYDHTYRGEITIKDEPMEVSMSYVTKPFRFVDHEGKPVQPSRPNRRSKTLPAIQRLALEP